MLEVNYKRLEKGLIALMLIGLVAMFQPWFGHIVELFEPLIPDANLGRAYSRDIAPIILRYGFYATLLSTLAYISLTHYSVADLRRARAEKGLPLTALLILAPIAYGLIVLAHLARGHNLAALLGVVNFICAIGLWNWKRWALIGLGLSAILELLLALSGSASLPIAGSLLPLFAVLLGLTWPRRTRLIS